MFPSVMTQNYVHAHIHTQHIQYHTQYDISIILEERKLIKRIEYLYLNYNTKSWIIMLSIQDLSYGNRFVGFKS